MLENVRNIGIMAHVDAGKTTTTERILYYSGTKHKVGDVDSGDTTTDFDPLERQKGITINSAAVSVDWADRDGNEVAINIIDTPGHVDFTAEVERSLRVLDGAVGVFCAVGGVEVQSETVWRQATKYKVPRLAYVNKLDRMGADFWSCVQQIKDKLLANPAVVTLPAGQDSAFEGIIDLIKMKFITRDSADKTNRNFFVDDIPQKYKADSEQRRHELLDVVSMASDEITDLILHEQPVPEGLIRKALRKGTLEGLFTPVHCGSAKMYQGVQQLLDLVVDCLPSPLDRPPVEGLHPKTKDVVVRKPDPKEPFSALAFKTVAESTGDLVYVRVYSGELKPGGTYLNTTINKTERVVRFYRMMGDKRLEMESAGPGDIVAAIGLKQTFTGQTLCDPDAPVALESITFPKPVVSSALSFAKSLDSGKVGESLSRLVRDDPTLKQHTDEETKETILSGMGELHLEISMEKLRGAQHPAVGSADPARQAARGVPPVVRAGRGPGVQVRQADGRPRQVRRHQRALPAALARNGRGENPRDRGLEGPEDQAGPEQRLLRERRHAGVDPEGVHPERGGRPSRRREEGVQVSLPVRGPRVRTSLWQVPRRGLVAGRVLSLRPGSVPRRRDAAGITLLEPIMKVVVVSPKQYQGSISGDINRRRGMIEETSEDKGIAQVMAKIPLANLFGYTNDLRSATAGTASFSMEFSHYAPVREELADLPKKDEKKR